MAREHEVVDDQRILAGSEQLRELHFARRAVGAEAVENIVLGNQTAGGKRAPGDGDRFHSAAKLDLFGQQVITGNSICGRLAGKRDAHGLMALSNLDEIFCFSLQVTKPNSCVSASGRKHSGFQLRLQLEAEALAGIERII
jgi:hypothetical protein